MKEFKLKNKKHQGVIDIHEQMEKAGIDWREHSGDYEEEFEAWNRLYDYFDTHGWPMDIIVDLFNKMDEYSGGELKFSLPYE